MDASSERERRERDPRRLYLLAEVDGEPSAAGFAGRSDIAGRGFVAPRVLPGARRRGIGTALLAGSPSTSRGSGTTASARTSTATTRARSPSRERFGFEEVDRRSSRCGRSATSRPPSRRPGRRRSSSIAERPELLREAYPLGVEGYADIATAERA